MVFCAVAVAVVFEIGLEGVVSGSSSPWVNRIETTTYAMQQLNEAQRLRRGEQRLIYHHIRNRCRSSTIQPIQSSVLCL